MTIINMHDAKTQLSALVARAEAGEEIVIARRNKPAVRLVKIRMPGEPLPPVELEVREHASDDTTGKEDIAAHYRRPPQEWDDMVERVGFAERERPPFDLSGVAEAVQKGREYTIMRDGRAVAKIVPVETEQKSRGWGAWEGRYVLPDTFFDPLPEDELRAWDGSDEPAACA